eukprot:7603926-Alexandrium_andersonii.AAC.1
MATAAQAWTNASRAACQLLLAPPVQARASGSTAAVDASHEVPEASPSDQSSQHSSSSSDSTDSPKPSSDWSSSSSSSD